MPTKVAKLNLTSTDAGLQIRMNARDRLLLGLILPTEGSFLESELANEIEKKIRLTGAERVNLVKQDILIVFPNGGVDFDEDRLGETEAPFAFSAAEVEMIAGLLKDKAKSGKLPRKLVEMYRAFTVS